MEDNKQRNNSSDEKNLKDKHIEENAQSSREEKEKKETNRNWDLAQRRQQASPRSYSENTDSENIENQNTRAKEEQVDEETHNDRNASGENLGDKISERQQTIDEGDASKDRRVD